MKPAVIFAVLTVLWCGFIFYMSSENAEQSTARSDGVIYQICRVVVSDFDEMTDAQQQETVNSYSGVVRKLAHFTAYAVLGALLFQLFGCIGLKHRPVFAVAGAALYAVTDEFHQSFTPGRSAEVRDVLIDTGGALTAVLITLLIVKLIRQSKEKSEKQN